MKTINEKEKKLTEALNKLTSLNFENINSDSCNNCNQIQ